MPWTHILYLYDGHATIGYVPSVPGLPESVEPCLKSHLGIQYILYQYDGHATIGYVPYLPGGLRV